MKALVIGAWDPKVALPYKKQAEQLGYELATRGHTLVASPSSGIQGLVAQAYKRHGGNDFFGFFPRPELMEVVGEEVMVEPDYPMRTQLTYEQRNDMQMEFSDVVIGLTGRTGTLGELRYGVASDMPTAFYAGSSVDVANACLVDPDLQQKIHFGDDISQLVDYVQTAFDMR